MTVLLLLFQFVFFLFLFLLWFPWLGLSKLCWIILVRVDILVLFLILEEMLSVFHHWEWCLLWSVINGFYYVEVVSLFASFLESFYHKWVLNFVKSFFCIYWDDHMVFVLQFVNMVYHIDWFAYIKECIYPCIPGINPTWSWCVILLMCYWVLFASILLRIFASIFIRDIGL